LQFKDLSIAQSPWSDLTQISSLFAPFRKISLDVLGGLWHLLNFFAPAAGIGLFATLIAKLLWHRDLAGTRWWRLWAWAAGSAALVDLAGLVYFGRDGKMATYGGMVLTVALSLWWTGFRSRA